ncbi:MAG TPA: M12 family metallo-peptidase [Thermoanaerobaculia bacterium]|jgi:hypothetical protein
MIATGVALLAAAGPAWAAAPANAAAVPSIDSADFARTAATVAVGSHLRLADAQLTDTGETAALVLERFEVFASDARITVHGEGGDQVLPAPKHAYFRGVVEGKPDSRAFVAQLEDGTTQGMVSADGGVYLIGGDPAEAKALGGPLQLHRVDPVLLKSARNESFSCAQDKLAKLPGSAPVRDFTAAASGAAASGAGGAGAAAPQALAAHTARVAIESDHEFYALFNNAATATTYIGNLIGYSSTIYTAELNTSLVVASVSLWPTTTDPWTQTDTLCSLLEFGKYWNQNHTGDARTIAHFLSGKASGGGVAWLSALCHAPFSSGAAASCPGLGAETTNWGGGYGYTGNLSGNFNVNAPSVVWDILAVTHEIGHNFGSPHSHCYENIGGNANPIDQCYSGESGCYSGATSLPGPAGLGSGTIMSYCHLTRGSYSDVSLSFGTGFAYGVQPGRESAQMNGYVSSVVSSNPSCLAPVAVPGVFSDGFEGGLLPGPWSGKTP